MSGLFNTLNTANKGLTAQQMSLHTVGHNIANSNTRGYSRQRVELQADRAFRYHGVGQLGTGVRMTGITRSVSTHINRQVRNELGNLAKYGSRSEALDQLEMIFNEPSKSGLNYNLGEMFTSWNQLSENPELDSAKTVVVEKSKTLADTINDMANKINTAKDGVKEEIDGSIQEFNKSLEQLESLNKQIGNLALRGDVPNDLLDQRDLLLEDMANIANIEASYDEYGRANVSLGNETLVDSKDGKLAGLDFDGEKIALKDTEGNIIKDDTSDILRSGSLKGHLEGIEDINDNMDKFKNFTKNMAKAINLIHSDGGNSIDFFEFEESEDGFKLKVNQEIADDPSKVNSGKTLDGPSGDGSRAQAISKLQDTKLDFLGGEMEYDPETMGIKESATGKTIRGEYGSIVTKIGVSKKHSDDMIDNQLAVAQQLLMKKESVSGVSMNEEISDMIKFQQAYNANAKVISVISEMLDTLIQRTGV